MKNTNKFFLKIFFSSAEEVLKKIENKAIDPTNEVNLSLSFKKKLLKRQLE